jgi:hypothetical protein
MFRFPLQRPGLIACGVLAICATIAFGSSSVKPVTAGPPAPIQSGASSVPPSAYVPGVGFLQPQSGSAAAPLVAGTSFNADYVRQVVGAHLGLKTLSGAAPAILSVAFMTSAQARATILSGDSTGRPDSELVGVVTLQGPIDMSNAPHDPLATIPPLAKAYLVFDAQTGNLLVWGGK